jgi:hypothetical protein
MGLTRHFRRDMREVARDIPLMLTCISEGDGASAMAVVRGQGGYEG